MSGAGISRPRRSLRPSRVTASSGLRQCQVYGPRPGLAKSRAVAAPAAVPTPLSPCPAANAHARFAARMSRGETDFCHISTARSGDATTTMSHRRGQDHHKVTSWWLPGRRRVASTPYGVGIGRYKWRQGNLGTLGIDGAVSAAAGRWPAAARGQNKRRRGDKTSGGPGTVAKRPTPRRGRPRCALVRRCAWSGGAPWVRLCALVRRWLRLGRRPGCGSCWGRPGYRGPSWW
jgi:hypothetical protein